VGRAGTDLTRGGAGLAGLRIGLLTASASRAGGGVFEAVVRQAALIGDAGGEAAVFALADAHADADRARFSGSVRHFPVRGPRQIGWVPGLVAALIAAELDLLHLHGIWMYPSRAGARWAATTGRPYLISPHGMLDPWIVARGRWKKALARAGYERGSWRRAAALHALTGAEAADVARETGRDSLIIPNAAPATGAARTAAGRELLYLGRIHPKKNLAGLIAAWRRVDAAGATLTIAGWGEAADVAELERHVAAAGPSVRFVGPAHGADKARLLREARALVLPSFSEGLPMVVLEAWAAGTPTVMTAACNLPEGFAAGAALACETEPASIAAALGEVLAMNDSDWATRSAAARALAAGPFGEATVAARWTTAYRELAA
jgi:poly(glycerol-phosphate) alpha-glucosyltransferase